MTIQELKEHCQQQCRKYSILAEHYKQFSYEDNKTYQEHTLVLQLIERLELLKECLKHDNIYILTSSCEMNPYAACPNGGECEDCPHTKLTEIYTTEITTAFLKKLLDSSQNYTLNENCFFYINEAQAALKKLNNYDYTCPKCNHKFSESDAYKWRINNRLIDCCPNCKQPIMYAKENKYE